MSEVLKATVRNGSHYANDPISAELSGDYGKIIAAKKLGELPASIVIESALCRATLSTTEDDRVRTESLQQLLNWRSNLLEVVLFALLFDDDDEMRLAAIEGLVLAGSDKLNLAVEILEDTNSDAVCMLAKRALSGESIELYRLDPPS